MAAAEEDKLLKLWEGLGYYNRARNLQKCARVIVKDLHGEFPTDYDGWLALPGIGPYTAGAVASICFDCPVAAVDGNVLRVITRFTENAAPIDLQTTKAQIKADLEGVTADQVKTMVIAYEPIWAIGTGKTATADQAQEVCAMIRHTIAEMYDEATAEAVRIQYGGSMNAGNAAELLSKPDIDGGLIGGAALKPDFGKIVNYNK